MVGSLPSIVNRMVELGVSGLSNSTGWVEPRSTMKTRIGKWMHRESALTLGGLLEEARALPVETNVAQKLKDEVVKIIREAHEIHHIAFEQKL